jgi:hypothetical protein
MIKIELGSREEVFRLEDETLIGRRACLKRANLLHDEALAYIMHINAANSHNNDVSSTIQVDQPNHVVLTLSPPISPHDPSLREPMIENMIISRDLTQDMARCPGSRLSEDSSARVGDAGESLWDEDTWGTFNLFPDTYSRNKL